MSRARPWRAAAWWPCGAARVYAAHASATSNAGLDGFAERWSAQGCVVERWEVLPEPQITAAAEASATTVERHGVA